MAKSKSVGQEIFRFEAHDQVQGCVDRVRQSVEDNSEEALERAVQETKDLHARARGAIIYGRLF